MRPTKRPLKDGADPSRWWLWNLPTEASDDIIEIATFYGLL